MLRIVSAVFAFAIAMLSSAVSGTPARAQAASCDIRIEFVSGGLIIGASGGSGSLVCDGKRYPLTVGGVSLGAIIGVSKAQLYGKAYNVSQPGDVAGTYGAAEAGYALLTGKRAAKLKNTKGVVLELRGRQVGLEFSLDLSGLQLGLK